MKKWFLLFLVTVAPSLAVCQQTTQPAAQETQPALTAKEDWRVIWRNATIAFGQVGHDKLTDRDFFSAVGTGLLIAPGEHVTSAYIVTARHVFCDPEKRWFPLTLNIRFSWQDHKSIFAYTGIPLPLRTGRNVLWATLDDDSDIAALPIKADWMYNSLPSDDRALEVKTIGLEKLGGEIYEGEQVFVLGYPAIAGNDRSVRAFLRQGIVAWTNPTNPDAPFLVDANLFEGNSGGPVLKFPYGQKADGTFSYVGEGRVTLLGIVSQGTTENVQSTTSVPKIGKIETHMAIPGVGAIGVIEPVNKISKLLTAMQEGKTKTPVCDVPEPK